MVTPFLPLVAKLNTSTFLPEDHPTTTLPPSHAQPQAISRFRLISHFRALFTLAILFYLRLTFHSSTVR
jgi:hypothetical protein